MIIFVLSSLALIVGLAYLIPWWIRTYNQFQLYRTVAERQFADVDVMMQQRLDNIHALAHSVARYDGHEQQVIRDAIEARSHWSKDVPLDEKIALIPRIEDAALKLKALAEQYPILKADQVHISLMNQDNEVELRLRQTRLDYNGTVQEYNQRTRFFPQNIVALVHDFTEWEYIAFAGQETYKPKELITS